MNKELNIVEMWHEIELPTKFKTSVIQCNKTIANKQLKSINEITEFINAQNYYGDNYQMRRQMQMDASKYWIKLYMPTKDNINKNLENIRNSTEKISNKMDKIVENVKYK
jgi:ribosomal protein L9